MPSLREVLREHRAVLLLDAAGATVHAGWFEPGAEPRWVAVTEEAGVAVFRALEMLQVSLDRTEAFVFCEGPGSVLGVRTVAVALRTWAVLRARPILAYRSLELLAAARGRPGLTLIADARKQSWHALTVQPDGRPGPLRRLAPADLQPPLARPDGFRHWTPLPAADVALLPYDLPSLWAAATDAELLRATTEPDAFLHDEPAYVTWTPRVHQAPAR